ncbi:MAG: DUF3995 domain-containing protein [Streptosporangiales bacterium]|nr:DUF3995 domain-containing protein [Streptosporangiales bacterium]
MPTFPRRERAEVVAPRRRTWAAHAAALWAFAFATMSFYWAAGGTFGVNTLSNTIEGLAGQNAWFTAVVWVTGALKAAGGMLALALVRPWGERLPRRLLLIATAGAGGVMALYALANLGARAIQAIGLIPTPASMHTAAAWWHLLLWDPWFLAGGVLFLLAAWQSHTSRGVIAR